MASLQSDVLVIGGGATGTGVAWDAALRGLEVVLAERGDLATGTSGRFHGLLHSGGRYAVKDPRAARECAGENEILRRVAADCIEDTGGLFLSTPWDDPAYADSFVSACARCGVACQEIDPAQALEREPRLNPAITRAFSVADASVDVWKLVWALARGAAQRGARILPYHAVVEIHRDGEQVSGARLRDVRSGEELDVEARVTINAAGAWAGQIAELAGIEGVRVLPGRGIMIAVAHRLVDTVVQRCNTPGDGDIVVPIRTVCVIGTTDRLTEDPDDQSAPQPEIDQMLDGGERLLPGFRQARALRVWSGVRPLFSDDGADAGRTRDVTRAHALLDHRARDGVRGLITITGGKLTTFRLMAQETVDAACAQLGERRPCATAGEVLSGSERRTPYRPAERLERKEAHLRDEQTVCECELVERGSVEAALAGERIAGLDDLRRRLRLGMGPCQGGFCIYRAAGIMHELGVLEATAANTALRDFLQERWKGSWPVLYGDQLRQARFDGWLYQGVLDVCHLPRPAQEPVPGDEVGLPA